MCWRPLMLSGGRILLWGPKGNRCIFWTLFAIDKKITMSGAETDYLFPNDVKKFCAAICNPQRWVEAWYLVNA